MCGIIYQYNFNGQDTSKRVLKQLRRQQHRGMTSFGFALPDKHKNSWRVAYKDIVRELRKTKNAEVLFHHRLATSTADRPNACHPFSTRDVFKTEFVGVHNGVLFNEHALYDLHKERFGIKYVSDNGRDFNDSEAYIYDLASYFSGVTPALEMSGYGAFILVEYDKVTKQRLRLHWGTTSTTSAPLRVHLTENHLDITSEGKGWLVEEDMHYSFDYATGRLTTTDLERSPVKQSYQYDSYYGYGSYGYESDYYDNYGFGAYKKNEAADDDTDDVPVWHDDNYLFDSTIHKGHSMYKDGCCEYCDMRMEFFSDYSPLYQKMPHSLESVLVEKALELQAKKEANV